MGEMKAANRREANGDKDAVKRHISEMPFTWANWYQHINWLNTNTIITLPLLGLIGAYYTPLTRPTFICAVLYYFITGMGITAGYHRLWAHRSYSASLPLQIWLAAVGAGAFENSIRRWSRDHRAHHRFTDTDKDPYSVRKGLLYSHLGWLVLLQDPKRLGRSDISDLNVDPVVVWQHKHYVVTALFMGMFLPSFVCGVLFHDWLGGLVYAGILRIFFVQQATFCVNSVAHWLGDQPFDDRNSPKDHALTAFLTLGEGYHNFHHEFPSDYRNAISWHQYDPTKWSIYLWKQIGLAYDLKTFRQNEIDKGRFQQEQKALDRRQELVKWPYALEELPLVEWEEFRRKTANGDSLVVIAGVVHDVGDFMKDHPGGRAMIRNGIGSDATASFNGGIYSHSQVARRLLSTLRIGVLRGGCEIEVLKTEMNGKAVEMPAVLSPL